MAFGESTSADLEAVAKQIVDSAFTVHSEYGPGLLDSVYEACLAYELSARGLKVQRQVRVPIKYRGVEIDEEFRIDLLVENCVVVEVKAVVDLNPVYRQQVKTYLKLTNLELGFLINVNVPLIKDGIKRIILN